jgi:dienelactone hydrolase
VNESEMLQVEQYYANLTNWIRLFGAEELGRRYVIVRLARMEVNSNLGYTDLHQILERITDQRTWYSSWRKEGAEAEETAEKHLGEGHPVSAADMFLRAAHCYHWGQYLARIWSAEKAEGRAGRVRCYRRAVGHLDVRVEPIGIPFRGATMPGYLHLPETRDGRAALPPCVIMVCGIDSVKEEYHNWAQQFVRRGLAALTFDGPGQGEMVGVLPMSHETWEEPMGAVIDALTESELVDPARIGTYGSSTGGFLISRAAAFEPRIRAAISNGGFYDFRDRITWPVSTQLNVMEDLMLNSLQEAREYIAEKCTLAGVAERIACPYLVIHGARDDQLTVEEAKQMADEAQQGEFVCFEDGFHTCTNLNAQLVPLMCDWMAAQLG